MNTVQTVNVRRAKVHCDWSNSYWDMAIFDFSKRRPSAILDFKKMKFWSCSDLRGLKCVTIPNFIAIRWTVGELWWLNGYSNGGYLSSCIFKYWNL